MVINLPTDTKQLILTEDNDVITITLNNPQYKNALSEELTPHLRTILKKLKKQDRYKILLIRGKGIVFVQVEILKKWILIKKILEEKI